MIMITFSDLVFRSVALGYRTEIVTLNKQNPAPFSTNKIENYGRYLTARGITLKPETKTIQGDVPLDKIVGIDQMYGDISWVGFLKGHGLKRIDSNLKLLTQSPEYYLNNEPKTRLSFIRIGDNYFIREGKHRTVIARFFAHFNPHIMGSPPVLKNVTITEQTIDAEFMRLSDAVEQLKIRYPYLYFSLDYTDDEDTDCMRIHHRTYYFSLGVNCTRSNAWGIIEALNSPSLWGKVRNYQPHHLISYRDIFAHIKANSGL